MTINIFIGYDPREIAAYHVACHSVLEKTKEEVAFFPITGQVQGDATNLFSHERWDIPRRMGYRGWAIYMECDMLARAPLDELWAMCDGAYDVLLAKHPAYRTKHPVKYWGQPNLDYPRKNWSSFMLINCSGAVWQRLPWLQPEISDLHRFSASLQGRALFDQDRIGDLGLEWNWLVGEYQSNAAAKLVHFTIGGPYFEAYRDCDYADEWRATRDRMLHVEAYAGERAEATAA